MHRVLFTIKVLLCMSLLTMTNLYAAPNASLGYSVNAQAHDSEDEDDVFLYGLALGLSDDYYSSQLVASYDISSVYLYEQKREDDNLLLNGVISSEYKFTHSFSWLLNTDLSEINTLNNNDFDQLDTQTLAITTTGFRYTLEAQIKGDLTIEALTNIYYYEESPLDARENLYRVSYLRPLSSTSELTTSYSTLRSMYDDSLQEINDTKSEILRVDYQTRLSRYTYDLFWEPNRIEYVNQPIDVDIAGYGIGVRYDINTRSSINVEYGKLIQQAFVINAVIIDPQNPVLTSGLVVNKYHSIQYQYNQSARNFSLAVYQNNIRDLVSILNNSERQKGAQFTFTEVINEKVTAELAYTLLESEINTNDSELTSGTLNYLLGISRYVNSTLSLIIEEGKDNNVDNDDVIIQLNLSGALFD